MSKFQIYLAGGMQDMSFEESNEWRTYMNNQLEGCRVINPNDFYNMTARMHYSQHEVREFDLYYLKRSDLIIVNFNNPQSIGTAQEIAIAKEYNIPVIGLNESRAELHPWLLDCVNKMFSNRLELVNYVQSFYGFA